MDQSSTTDEPYTRRLLLASSRAELLLATWREEGRTLPHDHGGARGIVWIVRGRFEEQRYRRAPHDLVLVASRTVRAPYILRIGPDDVHAMTAMTPGAQSLHVYAPGACAMRVYDETMGRVLTVAAGSGAWAPSTPQCILRAEVYRCAT